MSSVLRIDPASTTPPYEQLRGQLAAQMASGELAAGDRLPTVRRLAGDLGLAAGTVARAYRELESAGHVRTAGRRGTVVVGSGDAAALTDRYVRAMRELGHDVEGMTRYVRRAALAPVDQVHET